LKANAQLFGRFVVVKKFPVKSFQQFSENFRKNRNKFPEISGNVPEKNSGLTTLVMSV